MSLVSALRRRAASNRDAGFTLVELLVAMTLLSIVLGLLVSATITALNSESGVNARAQNATTASLGVNRMTQVIREAILLNDDASSAFSAASATSMTFTSEMNTMASGATTVTKGPTTVTFSLGTRSGSCPSPDYCLLETDTPSVMGTDSGGDAAWVPGSSSTTRVLVHSVDPAAAAQLFTYYQTNETPSGNPAAPHRSLVQLTLGGGGSLPSSSLGLVSMVQVSLSVKNQSRATAPAPATNVTSQVYLPNTSEYAAPAAIS